MFSKRASWDLTPNRLSAALARLRHEGRALLDLTESNPTRAGLGCPDDVLSALAHPEARTYAPDPRGLLAAREAVCRELARGGVGAEPSRVVLTASTSEAYSHLFKLLCDPGDAVLVPRPSYPLFEFLAGLEAVATVPYPLGYDGRWFVDLPALTSAVTPRTRAVVVVNPNNPTGSYLTRDERAGLDALCARQGLALVADEVFFDFAFGPDAARGPSTATGGQALAFTLGGLSKSCGLPQLKLGWIVTSGPASLVEPALARLEVVADTYLSVGTPVQQALPRLLTRLPDLQAPIRERVEGNLAFLRRSLPGSTATSLHVEGGWYAVVQVPAVLPEEEWAQRLLERDSVLVHPGFFFDFPREAFLVLSLLPLPEDLREGTARLLTRLDRPDA